MTRTAIAFLTLIGTGVAAQEGWPVYGHDAGGARYSPLREINTGNVTRLKRAWVYHTGDVTPLANDAPRGQHQIAFEATPLVIDDVMYLVTTANRIVALDANTGHEIWTFSPWSRRKRPAHDKPSRGLSYWPGNAGVPPRILAGTSDGRLIALNARTGLPVPGFGDEGEIDLRQGVADSFPNANYDVTSPPVIYRNMVITGAEVPESPGLGPSGDVRAFNVQTGKVVWRFHTIPQPGEPGHETWKGNGWKERTGTNVWSIMTLDEERGLLFLPVGSPAYDFYGGDRKGQNLYGDSLVALRAETGEVVWHYQFVHHDVWDYDPPAPPALITAQGKPAVVEVTKMGLVFILDRLTGRPLFDVTETPVPQSQVPGEETWPTQPVPTKPAPLSRSTMTAGDLTTVTAESHRYCAELFAKLTTRGRYTPFDLTPTLVFPGTLGGATWSGVSYDPERKLIFVNANEVGAIGQLTKQPEGARNAYERTSPLGGYARFWDTNHYPCQQPPWGTLSAIDVDTGETVWKVPLGITRALEKVGIRNTGTPNIGGSIATAGGLVFIGASADERFRAFDAATGKELWTATLDGSAYATPITYRTSKGQQFVAVAAGGGGFFSEQTADTMIAFSLAEPQTVGKLAPKPLYRDPVYDGAADPVLVWDSAHSRWLMFYTNRRARAPNLQGVAWVHGTRIGVAESRDGGAQWNYIGTAQIPYGKSDYTHWAPEIITHDGLYHMYLSIVPGTFNSWDAARDIIHLTSNNLNDWKYESTLQLGSDRVIDPSVIQLPNQNWRMWYKNERAKDGTIYYADSPDLYHWTGKGVALPGSRGEGPKAFRWKDSYWLIVDAWGGFEVYRSDDCLLWILQDRRLLQEPGTIATDRTKGNHCDVVVSGDRAYMFYFTHQVGLDAEGKGPGWEKHTDIQVVELEYQEGKLRCDRDQPAHMNLLGVSASRPHQ